MARPVHAHAHDDGHDRWAVVEARPAPALSGWADRYGWWSERTQKFTARRELAATTGALIVNLGAPLEIVDATGHVLRLDAGPGVRRRHCAGDVAVARDGRDGRAARPPAARRAFPAAGCAARRADRPLLPARRPARPRRGSAGRGVAGDGRSRGAWRVLDTFLARRSASAPDADAAIDHARHLLTGGQRVEQVAAALGWSRKRLARRFRDAVGLQPRAFAGLARFERFTTTLRADPTVALAAIALDVGYADQAHLSREVQRYAGLSPAALRARLIPDGGGVRA